MKQNCVVLQQIPGNATEGKGESRSILSLSANPTVGHPQINPHDTKSGKNLSLPS